MHKHNLFFLFLMELCAGAARGAYLVCIGWTTLIVSGDVARVGQVFIAGMLTILIGSPLVGIIVDRYNRKTLTLIAHAGMALSLGALGYAIAGEDAPAIFLFFVTVVAVTLLRMIYQSSHDGLIHANVPGDKVVDAVARFRGIHLLATALGTVATGIVIERQAPEAGFYLAALFSVLLVIAVAFVRGIVTRDNPPGFRGFIEDFAGGLALFRQQRTLRTLTLLAGVALPLGQLSNAILSSFIHDDLGRGSDVFGYVDAAWPIGGMAAAALLSLGLKRLSANGMEYLFAALGGLSTILLSLSSSVLGLALAHAAMGFTVWLCRIVIDGRVLQICSEHTVGRTKVYIEVMFSFAAVVMCLSPTLVTLERTNQYFLFWGGFAVIVATLLWFLGSRRPIRPNGH